MWLLLLQAALALSLQVHDALESPPCSPHTPGMHLIQLQEIQRQFLLVVPQEYAPAKPFGVPLVLGFHGFSDSPWYFNLVTDFSKHISRYGWLGILPFGLNQSKTNGLDGASACCPEECQGECCMKTPRLRKKDDAACNWSDNENDLKFVQAILKWATHNSCVDTDKVFATGFSAGAILVNYLACHASNLIRGFAPMSGDMMEKQCEVSRPISYVSMCGSQDDEAFCQYFVEESGTRLSLLNHCSGAGPEGGAITSKKSATTFCRSWDLCPEDNFVEICHTQGLAHDVSGHLRPDNTSYIRPGSDLDFVEYAFQKFSLLANGSILFWGAPTPEQLRYKESMWPPPHQSDHLYIRNGSLKGWATKWWHWSVCLVQVKSVSCFCVYIIHQYIGLIRCSNFFPVALASTYEQVKRNHSQPRNEGFLWSRDPSKCLSWCFVCHGLSPKSCRQRLLDGLCKALGITL